MPHARTTDPSTSHEAAASIKNVTPVQAAILGILFRPMTDEQLIQEYRKTQAMMPRLFANASDSGIRSRRAELVKQGLVFPVGYGKTKSNRNTIVWSA